MFDEVPNRRITERRSNLKEAALASLGIAGGVSEAIRKGGPDWETLAWILVFAVGAYSYWQQRARIRGQLRTRSSRAHRKCLTIFELEARS